MSVRVMTMVWDADLGSAVRKLVMMRLADFSNDDGDNIFPSVARIARDCGVDERTVKRTLAEFRAEGLLHVISVGGWDGKKNATTHYRLQVERLAKMMGVVAESHPRGGVEPPPVVAQRPPRGGVESPNPSVEPSKEPSKTLSPEKSGALVKREFEEWYRAYPRKVAKGRAWKAYLTARTKKKVAPDVLIEGISRLCTDDPQFIPHPATWLNAERWLDEPEPARRYATSDPKLAAMYARWEAENARAGMVAMNGAAVRGYDDDEWCGR